MTFVNLLKELYPDEHDMAYAIELLSTRTPRLSLSNELPSIPKSLILRWKVGIQDFKDWRRDPMKWEPRDVIRFYSIHRYLLEAKEMEDKQQEP